MDAFALAGLGLVLGLRHAADTDHVVAVAAIASRYKRVLPAALIGAFWGLGHTLTICVVGGAIILFNLVISPRVGLALEFAVGIVLTLVGLLNLSGRGGFVGAGPGTDGVSRLRPFLVGLVHGLAGSAAIALLVLATVREPLAACAYLLVFSLGTILGMMVVTVAFASPLAWLSGRFAWSGRGLRVATGLLSVAFGMWVMFEIGWVDGLFGAAPRWDPH